MKTFIVLAAVIALGGCASHSGMHHPGAPHDQAARYDHQMKRMSDMHQKMTAAKTPQERQALMAEHMQAMQGGMSMMCEMRGHGMAMQGGASADLAKRCMDMKDMMTNMMLDRDSSRVPPAR